MTIFTILELYRQEPVLLQEKLLVSDAPRGLIRLWPLRLIGFRGIFTVTRGSQAVLNLNFIEEIYTEELFEHSLEICTDVVRILI